MTTRRAIRVVYNECGSVWDVLFTTRRSRAAWERKNHKARPTYVVWDDTGETLTGPERALWSVS